MLVEHTFVTTKEAPEALSAARDLLVMGGFWVTAETENFLEVKRGREKVSQAKGLLQLPQQVRVEFDRGRVSVAVLIQHDVKASSKCRELLLAIAEGLEKLLARGLPVEEVRRPLHELEAEIAADFSRRRKRTLIFAIVVLVIVFSCLGGLVAIIMSPP